MNHKKEEKNARIVQILILSILVIIAIALTINTENNITGGVTAPESLVYSSIIIAAEDNFDFNGSLGLNTSPVIVMNFSTEEPRFLTDNKTSKRYILHNDTNVINLYQENATGGIELLKTNASKGFIGGIEYGLQNGTNITYNIILNQFKEFRINISAEDEGIESFWEVEPTGEWKLGQTKQLSEDEDVRTLDTVVLLGNLTLNLTTKNGLILKGQIANGDYDKVEIQIPSDRVITPSCNFNPTGIIGNQNVKVTELNIFGEKSFTINCSGNLGNISSPFSFIGVSTTTKAFFPIINQTQTCIATVYENTQFTGIAYSCAVAVELCGNGICEATETNAICNSDCDYTVCGDGVCNGTESSTTCSTDCPTPPSGSSGGGGGGSRTVQGREHTNITGSEAPGQTQQQVPTRAQESIEKAEQEEAENLCGNGIADEGETCENCPEDLSCNGGLNDERTQSLLAVLIIIIILAIIITAIIIYNRKKDKPIRISQ